MRFRQAFRLTALAVMLALTAHTAAAAGFADVQAPDPDVASILALQAAGVVDGYPDGSFRPSEPITRAEFVKMVLLSADPSARDIPAATACDNALLRYHDAAESGSLTTFVCQAWYMGAVRDDHFYPGGSIPRGEAAEKVIGRVEICLHHYTAPYTDIASSEFEGGISIAYGFGWFRPPGTRFEPEKPLLRREAAAMLARALPAMRTSRASPKCIAAVSGS